MGHGQIKRAGSATTLTPAGADGEPTLSDLPSSSPRIAPARLTTAPYSAEYDLGDLDLGHSDHATYSSLPPSPRGGKFDFDYSHHLQLDFHLDDVLARLDPDASPRVQTNRRRLSLDSVSASAHESERELEEVEQFWPARSRRQTLDTSQVPPLISPTSETHSVPDRDEAEAREESGLSIWDLLRDEEAAEQWEGWIADGKWYVSWICFVS